MREADEAAGQLPQAGGDSSPQAVAVNVEPQPVASPITGAAIFLVVTIGPGPQHADTVRGLCADLAGLIRAVGFRDLDGHLTCVTGFGAQAWDRLAPASRVATDPVTGEASLVPCGRPILGNSTVNSPSSGRKAQI